MTVVIYTATRSGTESLQAPEWTWCSPMLVFRKRKRLDVSERNSVRKTHAKGDPGRRVSYQSGHGTSRQAIGSVIDSPDLTEMKT